jgi:hypothetical protein
VFDHNSASNDAGAVDWGAGALTLNASSLTNNSAGSEGGALDLASGSSNNLLTMVNTTFGLNHSANDGGAIFADRSMPATLTNDTIAGNSTSGGTAGGISFGSHGSLVLTNGTVTGSGVWNTIVASNSPSDCGASTFNASFDKGFNLDSDSTCFGGLGIPTDQTGVTPLLGPPAANGGPSAGFPGDTAVVATEAEQAGSPSVDKGTLGITTRATRVRSS